MNRIYKGLAVSLALLALAGCAPQTPADNSEQTQEQTGVEVSGENATGGEEGMNVVTLDNITDEQLAKMTGLEADYQAYMQNPPSRIGFLKEENGEMNSVANLTIYSGQGEDSTALYIYEEDGVAVSAKLDEFAGSVSPEGIDYDYMFYTFAGMLEKQPAEETLGYTNDTRETFEADFKKQYTGQPLYELHEKLGVYVPIYRYEMAGSENKLNTYTIVSPVGYTASTDLNVIYDAEGMIVDLYLDDSYGPGKNDPFKKLAEYVEASN